MKIIVWKNVEKNIVRKCEKTVENNNMGKLWKICEKNSVEKNIGRKV